MNNLSSFDEFSRGAGKNKPSLNFSIPTGSPATIKETDSEVPETAEILPQDTLKKPQRFQRARTRMMEESKEGNIFKDCYDVVEAEYTHLLKDLNRIEYSDSEKKKHVTDLKKAFNELLVKLQFFSENDKK